jgi:hypothetical protein
MRQLAVANGRCGSFSTDPVIIAYWSMSASPPLLGLKKPPSRWFTAALRLDLGTATRRCCSTIVPALFSDLAIRAAALWCRGLGGHPVSGRSMILMQSCFSL